MRLNDTVSLFQIEGVSLVKPKELGYYIQNSRLLKKFIFSYPKGVELRITIPLLGAYQKMIMLNLRKKYPIAMFQYESSRIDF